VGDLNVPEVLEPAPKIISVQVWRPIGPVPPTFIDPGNHPFFPPMTGDTDCLISHLLQRLLFDQLLGLLPVTDIVLPVSGVFALPITRCILVTVVVSRCRSGIYGLGGLEPTTNALKGRNV
jgi:hypothetical protein